MVVLTLSKGGYATPMTIPPNVKYADLFKKLYEEAREQKRGLWSDKEKLEADNDLCDIPIASWVKLTPYDECVIDLYKKRCSKGQGDDCIVRCIANGGAKEIGWGCWHFCNPYGMLPHKGHPPGVKNCEHYHQPRE